MFSPHAGPHGPRFRGDGPEPRVRTYNQPLHGQGAQFTHVGLKGAPPGAKGGPPPGRRSCCPGEVAPLGDTAGARGGKAGRQLGPAPGKEAHRFSSETVPAPAGAVVAPERRGG